MLFCCFCGPVWFLMSIFSSHTQSPGLGFGLRTWTQWSLTTRFWGVQVLISVEIQAAICVCACSLNSAWLLHLLRLNASSEFTWSSWTCTIKRTPAVIPTVDLWFLSPLRRSFTFPLHSSSSSLLPSSSLVFVYFWQSGCEPVSVDVASSWVMLLFFSCSGIKFKQTTVFFIKWNLCQSESSRWMWWFLSQRTGISSSNCSFTSNYSSFRTQICFLWS